MRTKELAAAAAICTLAAGVLAGCALSGSKDTIEDTTSEDMVKILCEGIELPAYEVIKLDSANFKAFAFTDPADGLTGVAADALVNITPHSLVVLHSEDGNAQELAKRIFDAADPNKWLCVGSEMVEVGASDHFIMLVMSDEDITEAITANFANWAYEGNDGEAVFYSKENTIRAADLPEGKGIKKADGEAGTPNTSDTSWYNDSYSAEAGQQK